MISGANGGMQGRSGGAAIMHREAWEFSEHFVLDLEAAPKIALPVCSLTSSMRRSCSLFPTMEDPKTSK